MSTGHRVDSRLNNTRPQPTDDGELQEYHVVGRRAVFAWRRTHGDCPHRKRYVEYILSTGIEVVRQRRRAERLAFEQRQVVISENVLRSYTAQLRQAERPGDKALLYRLWALSARWAHEAQARVHDLEVGR
jgi:hypothetical protein